MDEEKINKEQKVGQASVPANHKKTPVGQASLPATPFYKYRRKLPHWRESNAAYFVTWRIHKAQSKLNPKEKDSIVSALRHFENQRYEIYSFVVMDDHIHLLFRPLKNHELQEILHSLKSYTANQLQREFQRKGAIWQTESMDRIVRNEKEFIQKANYIHDNPFNKLPGLKDYQWYGVGINDVGKG